jgi:hypothetical protein
MNSFNSADAAVDSRAVPRSDRKYFTIAQAMRALPLVRRIASDIQAVEMQRRELIQWAGTSLTEKNAELDEVGLGRKFESLSRDMVRLIAELSTIGVELKDPARGLLDFPAIFEGREILLCWQLGETSLSCWHEVDAGFAGRRSINELNRSPETVG